MTPNGYYTCAAVFYGIVAICSIGLFTDRLSTKKKKIACAVIIICLVAGVWLNYAGKEKEIGEAKSSEKETKDRYDTLNVSMSALKHNDSLLISKADSQLRKCGFMIKGNEIQPIIDNSINVTSNNQKGGTTGFNITNH